MATVGELINAIAIMEKALRELQLNNPDSHAQWEDESGETHYKSIDEWVEYVLYRVRNSRKTAKEV